jgi:hypothetical protein
MVEATALRPASEAEALEAIGKAGSIAGISVFSKLVGWERTRAQRAVGRWERDGAIVRKPGGPGGKTVIEAVRNPAQPPAGPDAQPDAQFAQSDAHGAHLAQVDAHPAQRKVLGSIFAAITPGSISVVAMVGALVFVVLALVGTGLAMNARYTSSFGRSGEGETVLAVIGIAVDVLAMVLPATGCALWSRGHCLRAPLAWALWPVMVGFSLTATVGFSATHISATIAERSTAAIKSANKASDVQQWRSDRKAVTEARSVEELQIQLQRDRPKVDRTDRDAWHDTKGCTVNVTSDSAMKACKPVMPTLQALAQAKRRDDLDRKIKEAEKPPEGKDAQEGKDAPIVASVVDPAAESLSKLLALVTFGLITPTPEDVAVVRIFWAMVPGLAGLVLMFATGLLAPPRTTHD